jgi:hypothetical protein
MAYVTKKFMNPNGSGNCDVAFGGGNFTCFSGGNPYAYTGSCSTRVSSGDCAGAMSVGGGVLIQAKNVIVQ